MANRFWVGGTGTWDGSDTTHWAATSGAAGGQTVPGASDSVTFDASSGAGTVTVAVGAAGSTITLTSLTCGAHTGTLTFAGNNNNVTITGTGTLWFSGAGTGARTFNAGSGTWTLSGAGANQNLWNMATVTNLTNPTTAFASCTIALTNTSTLGTSFQGGGCTYGTVTFTGHSNKGGYTIAGTNNTFTTLNATAPTMLILANGITTTITNTLTLSGSSGSYIFLQSTSSAVATTLAVTDATLTYCVLRGVVASGAGEHSATNTIDLGGNSGWETLTAPSAATGGGVIGG